MALQLSVAARNARLNAIATALGASPLLKIYSGAQPADCSTAASGTNLASLTLPASPFATASGGSVAKSGTWSGTGSAAGTAGYFRLYDSTGTTCHAQGSITATGGGGDMTLDNTSIANTQAITVNTFTLTDANA